VFVLTGGEWSDRQTAVEDWFKHSMERVTGWYKRATQLILLSIGAVLVGSLNADTFWVFSYLSRNEASRAAMVRTAQTIAAQPRPAESGSAPSFTAPDSGLAHPGFSANDLSIAGLVLRIPAMPLGWYSQTLVFQEQKEDAPGELKRAGDALTDKSAALQAVQSEIDRKKAVLAAYSEVVVARWKNRVTGRKVSSNVSEEPLTVKEIEDLQKLQKGYEDTLHEEARLVLTWADTDRLAAAKEEVDKARQKLKATKALLAPEPLDPERRPLITDLCGILRKIAGLLLTLAALSLGGPFWFDVLTRFVNIRGTGIKPDAPKA
jgi:hypothetical protein